MASKPEFKSPDEVETVFYEAFKRCDQDVMAAVWAEGAVVCVHPGSGAIIGHDNVLRSWSHILSDAEQPEINYLVGRRTDGEDVAVHLVAEELSIGGEPATVVLATNVYQKFDQGWLMVEHHASLVEANQEGQTLQ